MIAMGEIGMQFNLLTFDCCFTSDCVLSLENVEFSVAHCNGIECDYPYLIIRGLKPTKVLWREKKKQYMHLNS